MRNIISLFISFSIVDQISRPDPVSLWTSLLELILLHPINFVRLLFIVISIEVFSDFLFYFIVDPLAFQYHV